MNSPPNSSDVSADLAEKSLTTQPSPYDAGAAAIEQLRLKDHARLVREAADAKRAAREKEQTGRMGRASIPTRYTECTFGSFPVERITDPIEAERARQARGICERYAETWPAMQKRGTNLILVGPMGSGKTGLACAIANTVIRQHAGTALFISAYGAVRHQRDTWRGRKGKTEEQALADLTDPDLLVLDEVGVQVGTEHEMLMLFEVLNGRYSNRRPTVLISNLPVEDWTDGEGKPRQGLRSFLTERLWNRYTDDSTFVLACDWPSIRGARP